MSAVLEREIGGAAETGERPLFFEANGESLYGVFHPPGKPRGNAPVIVFAHSVGLEHLTGSRLIAGAARLCARQGFPAFFYHARGHGDSAVDYEDVTVTSLIEDACAAGDQARLLSGASRIVWVALRFGALIAAEAMARRRDTAALALLEPVHRAEDFFREVMRCLLFAATAQGRRPDFTVEQRLQELERVGRVEAFGTYVHRRLYHSAKGFELARSLARWAGPTLLVQIQRRQQLSPQNARFKEALERRAGQKKVTVMQIGEEPAWSMFPHPPYTNEDLFHRIEEWLNELE